MTNLFHRHDDTGCVLAVKDALLMLVHVIQSPAADGGQVNLNKLLATKRIRVRAPQAIYTSTARAYLLHVHHASSSKFRCLPSLHPVGFVPLIAVVTML